MRKIFLLAAAACLALCGCNSAKTGSSSTLPEPSAEAQTQPETAPVTAAPAELPVTAPGEFGQPDPWTQDCNIVLIGEDGSYYYSCETGWYDGPFSVWYRDDLAGNITQLDIPAGIDETGYNYYDVLAMADGALWVEFQKAGDESADLCAYRDGQLEDFPEPAGSSKIRAFSEDGIYFVHEGGIWLAEYSGGQAQVCVPDVGTADITGIRVHEGTAYLDAAGADPGIYTCDLKTGECRYISPGNASIIAGDRLYFRQPEGIFRVSLDGTTTERLTDKAASHFCLCDEKLYYTTYQENSALYCLDESGETTVVLGAGDLPECTGINRVSAVDGQLFAEGYSGAFWYVIAEMQPDGSWDIVHQGEEG